MLGISRGEKGYAALPGRESDFKASLNTAIEYAVAVNCPRQAHIDLFWLCHFMCVCVYGDHLMTQPIVIQYYLCYLLYCRIHVLAGLLNDSISADEAEKTFISNIRQAADECSKVVTARNFHRDYTCTRVIMHNIIKIIKHNS